MKSGKEKVPFYENSSSYTIAGLMSLAGCGLMLAAAFLFTSCNFFVTPEDSKKDKEFEYTAENDVPASKTPFDEKIVIVYLFNYRQICP